MTRVGLADFFDKACTELLEMEERNHFPARLRVHPQTYDLLASLRSRELQDGFDLVILGLPVERMASLAPGEFHVVH